PPRCLGGPCPRSKVPRPGRLSRHPELLEAFPCPVEHTIELQAGQAMVGLDLLLALLSEVVPPQEVTVALDGELVQHLAHQLDLLRLADALDWIRSLVLEAGQTQGAVRNDLACALVVTGGEVPGEGGDEGRELIRRPHLTGPEALQQNPERLLVQVI